MTAALADIGRLRAVPSPWWFYARVNSPAAARAAVASFNEDPREAMSWTYRTNGNLIERRAK